MTLRKDEGLKIDFFIYGQIVMNIYRHDGDGANESVA